MSHRAASLFGEAETAWSERRLADAYRALDESNRLAPAAPTAFNLARVLSEMGRAVESATYFESLLGGRYGELEEAQTSEVVERLAGVRAAFATVVISGNGPGSARVRLDGRPVGELTSREELRVTVDPGTHQVVAQTARGDSEQTIQVGRGGDARAVFELPEPMPPASDVEAEGLLESPLFWIITGLVIAGGATAAILLVDQSPDQVVDPVFGNTAILRW